MELRKALETAWGSILGERPKNRSMVCRKNKPKETTNMGIGKDFKLQKELSKRFMILLFSRFSVFFL